MSLTHPIPLRLTKEQLAWIDQVKTCQGLTRSAAIRILIFEAMRLHRDGILPATHVK